MSRHYRVSSQQLVQQVLGKNNDNNMAMPSAHRQWLFLISAPKIDMSGACKTRVLIIAGIDDAGETGPTYRWEYLIQLLQGIFNLSSVYKFLNPQPLLDRGRRLLRL